MKHLLVLLLLLCSMSVSAQDVIVKKDGSTVVCRVVEVTATEITYKKWSDLNGSNYVMDKSLASVINYENGKKETFSETESLYKPNNQNDGEQAMNDKALLLLDDSSYGELKKMKRKNTFRWIGGICLALIGIPYTVAGFDKSKEYQEVLLCSGLVLDGAGTWLLCSAIKHQNQIKQLKDISLYQYHIQFPNGSFFSFGADMLSDRTLGSNTIGLGLRYNF